ncbi:MAG: type 4a pilus biogenesis protein PilO [Candidatus Omnitrophota bacterium]|jgi:Tfp pilus assembly protein PilO
MNKFEFIQRKMALGISIAIALIVIVIHISLYAPLIKKLKVSCLEYKAVEKYLKGARYAIEQTDMTLEDRAIITEDEVSLAIAELTQHGKLRGINFISIKPGEIISEKELLYKILPLEITMSAPEQKFASFIGTLANLKRSVIKVKSFEAALNIENEKKLKVDMVLDIYLLGGR